MPAQTPREEYAPDARLAVLTARFPEEWATLIWIYRRGKVGDLLEFVPVVHFIVPTPEQGRIMLRILKITHVQFTGDTLPQDEHDLKVIGGLVGEKIEPPIVQLPTLPPDIAGSYVINEERGRKPRTVVYRDLVGTVQTVHTTRSDEYMRLLVHIHTRGFTRLFDDTAEAYAVRQSRGGKSA